MGTVTDLPQHSWDEDDYPDAAVTASDDMPTVYPTEEQRAREEQQESDLKHAELILDGYGEMLSDKEPGMDISGNEAYARTCLELNGYSGNEGFGEDLMASGKAAYDSLKEVLSNIMKYFKGDGKARAEAAEEGSKTAIKNLAENEDRSAPIKKESVLAKSATYVASLRETQVIAAILSKHPDLKKSFEDVVAATSRIDNAQTVGQFGACLELMSSKAAACLDKVLTLAEEQLRNADTTVSKLRSPKRVGDTEPSEVKAAAKAEQKGVVDQGKEAVADARKFTSIQNTLIGYLNKIAGAANSVAKVKAPSKFKG
ncbi:hypothetical protein D9_0191 [Aeromonas phage D9]|nr:hypothetical protein D9_0191 [Aeromonas phage D9]